ncbi:MAG: HlyD family type I secretion periplasmic adaptor subunit [Rhodospirillales bacterium]|nr:HlyD family type I secretion periplasmic adaptor subunit [Rhodospirillales bacterium]
MSEEQIMERKTDRLDELVKSHPLPSWRPIAWMIMLLMAGGLTWSFFAELDEVTVAQGTVVPLGALKVIQHLEGGIIKSIFVKEGQLVKSDQPLLQLDVASSGLKKEELQVRLYSQMALKARLDAEANGGEPNFPQTIKSELPKLVATQKSTFDARKRELTTTLSVLENQIHQRELEVRELNSNRKSTLRNLKLANQRLADSADLLKQQLVPRDEHLKLEAEVEDLKSKISGLEASIPRTESTVKEAKSRRRETLDRFKREAQSELGAVEEKIATIQEEISAAGERGARLEIKSPINGIVKNMRYSTIGGVVKSGEAIMEIVPTGDKLIINAKLNPIDRGFVTEGQPARVKISTYDFVRYGALDGRVSLVAADVTEDPQIGPYFEVQIETDKTYLGKHEGELPITPGMQAVVDIHTGSKTVIDFLIKPVLKMKAEAFRER